jgi:hypothetical protein
MTRSGEWIDVLRPADVEEIERAVAHAESRASSMAALTAADFPLPLLGRRIDEWRREMRHGRGFVLVRGVPVRDWTHARSELFVWGLGLHRRQPRTDIAPTAMHSTRLKSTESTKYSRTPTVMD